MCTSKHDSMQIMFACSNLVMRYVAHALNSKRRDCDQKKEKIYDFSDQNHAYPFCKAVTICCLAPSCSNMNIILLWWLQRLQILTI